VPKIRYVNKTFREATKTTIDRANEIIDEYAAQGYDLTLRQLYYQFVSRDLLANTQEEYKRLGSVINDGRLAGLIDWDRITDRTRNLHSLAHWKDPAEIVGACANQFRVDKWATQEIRIEVWIEKEALAGVFERVCDELDIPFFSCRGYTSQSEMWGAGQRLGRIAKKQTPIILHFGDHDPSGIDMTRDIETRLNLFGAGGVCAMDLRRLALNMDQVQQYNPPPNPAKMTDARAAGYVAKFGDESWELDALEPDVLAGLVRGFVETNRDQAAWDKAVAREERAKKDLGRVARQWESVVLQTRKKAPSDEEE
jgi:hypothetical protein